MASDPPIPTIAAKLEDDRDIYELAQQYRHERRENQAAVLLAYKRLLTEVVRQALREAAEPSRAGWQPITTAPIGKPVLAFWRPYGDMATAVQNTKGRWSFGEAVYQTPTHWMPLPPAPSSDASQEQP